MGDAAMGQLMGDGRHDASLAIGEFGRCDARLLAELGACAIGGDEQAARIRLPSSSRAATWPGRRSTSARRPGATTVTWGSSASRAASTRRITRFSTIWPKGAAEA